MQRMPKANSFEEKFLFLYGFLGTMPIIQIFGFTTFTLLSFVFAFWIISKPSIKFSFSRKVCFFLFVCLSNVVSLFLSLSNSFPSFWKKASISLTIWQLLYLLIFLYMCSNKRFFNCVYYIKGVYYAACLHSVWGILQILLYKFFSVELNRIVFFDLFKIEAAAVSQFNDGNLVMTGFCWNAGNLAPLLVIGFALSSNVYLKFLFILAAIMSGSRTAIIGIGVSVIVWLIISIKAKYKLKQVRIITTAILVSLICFALVGIFKADLILGLYNRILDLVTRLSGDYLKTQSSSILHMRYWTSVPEITRWNHFINNVFGYGSGCSGYPFSVLYGQYNDRAWVVECDYINVLWSNGYIGFLLWYGWYFYSVYKAGKLNKKYYVLFSGLLIEGVTYNVTFNWCYLFLLMIFITISYKFDIFSEYSFSLRFLSNYNTYSDLKCGEQLK